MADFGFHYDAPKVRISDAEIVVQKTMIRTIGIVFRETRVFAVPNGAKRTRWAAQHAKKEGMSKGAPDLVIVCPGSVDNAWQPLVAFIEAKANAPFSAEQKQWHTDLHKMGHHCGVFRSDQTLVDKLKSWGFR